MNQNGLIDLLLLSGFANYFDRRIFFYNSVSDYETDSDYYEEKNAVNFNPNDHITATIDILTIDGDKFDYLLVLDPSPETPEETIISRWFVTEAQRLMNGQYRFTLRRDVVAESIGKKTFVIEAPIFVEKGHLQDNDPMIVNSEGMNFNQIKKSETFIKDDFDLEGYIVGYMESGSSIAEKTVTTTLANPPSALSANDIETLTGIDSSTVNDLLNGVEKPFASGDISLVFGYRQTAISIFYEKFQGYLKGETLAATKEGSIVGAFSWAHNVGVINKTNADVMDESYTYFNSLSESTKRAAVEDVLDNQYPSEKFYNDKEYNKLTQLVGQIVQIGGDYFTISGFVSSGLNAHPEIEINKGENSVFNNYIQALATTEADDWIIYMNYQVRTIRLQLTPYEVGAVKYMISSSAYSLTDAPYTMFVIPFGQKLNILLPGNLSILGEDGDRVITKEEAFAVAADIAKTLDKKLYDIQLLPFLPNYSRWYKKWTSDGIDYNCFAIGGANPKTIYYDFDEIKINTDDIGLIIYPRQSSFEQTIVRKLSLHDSMKVESQCNFYRLCSPNYNGIFEFNLAKMGGSVTNFYVSCTYKPYSPFIKVAPQFNFLYGSNFNDGRGLICGGEFSLPIITDAWTTYENNNKNFNNIFVREVQNLEVSQRLEKIQEKISAGAGTVAGAAGGAIAGAKFSGGNPYAIAGGAAAGLGAGALGGLIDIGLGEERRKEAHDYMLDRFNLNISNIKAIPLSLTRVSSFTLINKVFPFIEYYSCTDEEKAALEKKIQYDGMTVGRIGSLTEYMSDEKHYFKGQLIRAVGINEDSHFVDALFQEIAKGVYI